MNFWKNPENNSIKIVLLVVVLALAGFFVYKYVQTNSLRNTGQVVDTDTPGQDSGSTPTVSMVNTLAASSVGSSSAALNANVGSATGVSFVYGTTMEYGETSAASVSNGTATASITGLTPNTTYHYRVVSTNGSSVSRGGDKTFTTKSN
jgi:hypothetical protein